MARYKVYEVEERMTPNGKALKKLVLQGEGKQYPDKNVTMWANHPLFEETISGSTIDVEIDVQDSKTPNPHGGFYKNKTVRNTEAPQKAPAPIETPSRDFATSNSELKNLINFKVMAKLDRIENLLEKALNLDMQQIDDAFDQAVPE